MIGEVTIGAECYIGNHCVIRGDMNKVYIGEGTRIEDRVSVITLN